MLAAVFVLLLLVHTAAAASDLIDSRSVGPFCALVAVGASAFLVYIRHLSFHEQQVGVEMLFSSHTGRVVSRTKNGVV